MNRLIKENFSKFGKYAQTYKKAVRESLLEYRETMAAAQAESEKYKDSSSYMESAKASAAAKARNKIALARNAFAGEALPEIEALKAELFDQLTASPSESFLNRLAIYEKFNVKLFS